jgi:hypothetical protein
MTTFVTIPREVTIDAVTHVQHWRTRNFVVLQNYTLPVESSQEPMANAPQVAGQNMFHVYQVIQNHPGESLGEKLLTSTSVSHCMDFVVREEQLA